MKWDIQHPKIGAYLWSLHLDWHNTQHQVLNLSSKERLQYFFHKTKIKKQNVFPWKFQKILKGTLFHCQNYEDQKHL